MFKHYLKISLRNIIKDRKYSLINIIGLSIALACCFLLIFWVKFELSYERNYTNSKRIYQLLTVTPSAEGDRYSAWIYRSTVDGLKADFPQIEAATYLTDDLVGITLDKSKTESLLDVTVFEASMEDYLKMFSYEYVEGTPEAVIASRGIVISEELAHKLFGNESAIGKTIYRAGKMEIARSSWNVQAVVRVPDNTHLKFGILKNSEYNFNSGEQFIMLGKNAVMDDALEQGIRDYLIDTRGGDIRYESVPLEKTHLYTPKSAQRKGEYGNTGNIYLFSLAALLILLIAAINYINSSVARSINRMKEVGVRKVTGAEKRQLVVRFLFESFIVSFVAVIVAFIVTKIAFPAFSSLMGNEIILSFDTGTILIALAVCILMSVLAGGYAAFYLSSFNATYIFRGASKTGSKQRLRKALTGFQFFLSIGVLICAVFIYRQIQTIFTTDMGYDRNNIVALETGLDYGIETYINIIKNENPDVVDATMSYFPPYNITYGLRGLLWDGSPQGTENMSYGMLFSDHHYASVFGIEVVQGDFIAPINANEYLDTAPEFVQLVINETLREIIGVENPVGTTLYSPAANGSPQKPLGRIVGVVRDFNFKPIREPVAPLIMNFNHEAMTRVFVKMTGENRRATIDYLVAKYDEMKPSYISTQTSFWILEDGYRTMYDNELRTLKVISLFAFICLALSLMGVISMVSFMIEKRTKELAIRRINGARLRHLFMLFSRDIVATAIIASLFAIPLSYIIMSGWLEGYVYRTALSWWVFVAIPLAMILVTVTVIIIQVYFTARRRPVESLRSE